MTEIWVIENAPKAGKGHGRNYLNFGALLLKSRSLLHVAGTEARVPRVAGKKNLQLQYLNATNCAKSAC